MSLRPDQPSGGGLARRGGAAAAGELDATVTVRDFCAAWGRHRVLFIGGLIVVALVTYFYVRRSPKQYRATARVEIGRAFEPGVMIGVSDMAGAGEVRRLDESFETKSYDAMRVGARAESYLRSRALWIDSMAAAGGGGRQDSEAGVPGWTATIDVREINHSGIADVSLEAPSPEAATRYLDGALQVLRGRMIRHDFDYLERAHALYEDQLASETWRLTRLQNELARLGGATAVEDPNYLRVKAQFDAQAVWVGQLSTKVSQLALATRPEAQRAAVWVRVIDAAATAATPVRPRPMLAAVVGAGVFTFVFLAWLALAQLTGCCAMPPGARPPGGPAWDGGDDDG
jgi:hypothetical protein